MGHLMKSMKLVIPSHFLILAGGAFLPNMIGAVTAPIIFGKMHFLLIPENEFFHEIKFNGMTSFMDFMTTSLGDRLVD